MMTLACTRSLRPARQLNPKSWTNDRIRDTILDGKHSDPVALAAVKRERNRRDKGRK